MQPGNRQPSGSGVTSSFLSFFQAKAPREIAEVVDELLELYGELARVKVPA